MLDTIKELIRQNDLCVLATIGPQGPHTSLMAYTSSSDATRMFSYLRVFFGVTRNIRVASEEDV